MTTMIDEHPAFFDTAGRPLVDGEVFIGVVNSDPELNPTAIFSDRALSVVLANPQTIDALGRSTNKIWIPGEYSMKVEDSDGVQVYQELDNGETSGATITLLSNVIGADTVTATTAGATITAYEDGGIYILRSVAANTGAMTLDIDSVGPIDIVRNQDQAMLADQIENDQMVKLIYNSDTDNFEVSNQNIKTEHWTKGTDVASAAALDIAGAGGGNYFDITGTTTITSIGTLGTVSGTVIKLHFDAILTITHNATDLALPGAVNIITAANDEAEFVEYAVGDWRLTNYQTAITGVVQIVNTTDGAVATGTTTSTFNDNIPVITQGNEFMTLAITPISSTSSLKIDVVVNATVSVVDNMTAALFQDTTTNALAAVAWNPAVNNRPAPISFTHFMTSGTTSSTTFRVRVGGNTAGTTTFNGQGGTRYFGGVASSSITIQEII